MQTSRKRLLLAFFNLRSPPPSRSISSLRSGGAASQLRRPPAVALPHGTLAAPWAAIQNRGVKVLGIDVRVGNVIQRKGNIYQVLKAQHTQQERGGATIQVELRDVDSGNKITERFRTDEAIERVVNPTSKPGVLKVLTYNVWFREGLELNKRMKALGDLIQQHTPDVICFQEVTPNIYEIFQRSDWWKGYKCSLSYYMVADKAYFCMQMSKLPVKKFSCKPFGYSAMGRELSLADVDTGMGKSLVVATSHLESPCPGPPKWDQMYSKERVAQARESINFLDASPNVIFCGDMNWDDKLDGPFPMLEGWIDAWTALRPGEEGWTYDTKANLMLSGNRKLQKRLDRFMCSLRDFVVSSIEMLGMEAIPGLSYGKEKKVKSEYQTVMLPVLPSDHFGLLLTISQK